ncbi:MULTISPECIES: hypothetical protein [Arthrobacter]|uniref:DUF4149 domain-containing protein n=1 Tax=Arthrobacter psychrochitiniphilus TaxID=291045 RepID=A0A2V3DQ88_9MICC|nr:hypothetical protein [Arthrobacter psychrochitiniphilus]NYG18282.1 hypothetical protein [Arthrobacter psychrochitiniphilus]PXA64927.1 hypothetical protein CVS29_12085 [Arthrobacter psychrochitiniphilus]
MLALVVLVIVPFVWFGMIFAISFIETPLKFKAPGMTHALGVGIGRLVFKVLNLVEALLAVAMVGAWTQRQDLVTLPIGIILALPLIALALQALVLRPAMSARTKALSDTALTHSGGTAVKAKVATITHITYIASELLKAIALPLAGVLLLLAVAA